MNTEVLVGLTEIELSGFAPYVLQSCLLVPPVPEPEPEPENVISTPVPPGIDYEALPVIDTETQIIDTSPDQLIGCANELPLGAEQQILDSLFPGAISGDGVVNRDNNDIWTYDGSIWTNVGPTPGPQLVVTSVLPPWNEIVVVLGLIKAKISIQPLNYALEVTTEAGTIATKTKITIRSVRIIAPPSVSLQLDALPPIGVGVVTLILPPARSFQIEVFPPVAIGGPRQILPPSISLQIEAKAPVAIGGPTQIFPPSISFQIEAKAPVAIG
jgi:hypothetical protein